MIDHFGAPWVKKNVYELREDARRFETWENSYALRAGLGEAIKYAEEIGIDLIYERVQLLAKFNRDLLSENKNIQMMELIQKRQNARQRMLGVVRLRSVR